MPQSSVHRPLRGSLTNDGIYFLYNKEGGSKVRLALFLFVLLMESDFKYSILKEEKFLLGHPLYEVGHQSAKESPVMDNAALAPL